MLAIILLCASVGAPAPFVRPAKKVTRPSIVGVWKMTWRETHHEAVFYRDGFYRCIDTPYVGHWQLAGNRLIICETTTPWLPWTLRPWVVDLEPGVWRGKMEAGGVFRLD